ncbi:Uncharacterised protein [uncultured archaeon]|nr:Uncharacterised protein [uncultured archaeon]
METKTEKITVTDNLAEMNSKYLKQVKKARFEIKNDRKNFWNKNSVNFRNNIKNLVSFFEFPKKWNVSIVASRFLLDKHTMPYDLDVWSFSDVVGATENQGFDIVLFFNKTDLEFLSAPALLPIVVHEVKHVFQAADNPVKYTKVAVDDALNIVYEKEADAEVRKYSDEFRKENVLEKVLYCYDEEGWKGAKKMVKYLHEEAEHAFGGGYDQMMTTEEYQLFLKAEEEKDIDLFIDYFVDSIKDSIKEEEKKE